MGERWPVNKQTVSNSQIIVGLEIGTSKVCVAVGEVSENQVVNIIGLGQAKSRGVRKGEIIDVALAEEDVRNAIVEAEQVADVEIRSVFLGVTGSHIRGFNNTGVHPVVSADREITTSDIQDVIKNAKAINLPTDHSVVHVIRQHFRVDGQDGVLNPEGMLGAKIEVDVHVVSGRYNRLQNPIRLVSGLHLEVDNISSSALASSLAILSPEQKELGTLVIDLGAGVTEYAVYSAGVIKHTGVLAVGGDHVSNDLAYGLKVPLARAEQLKIDHGSAVIDPEAGDREIDLSDDSLIPGRQVNLGHMQKIMSMRLAGDLRADRQGHWPGGIDRVPPRGGGALRRRCAHPAHHPTGAGGVQSPGRHWPGQHRERHQERAGRAGVRHTGRADQVWGLSVIGQPAPCRIWPGDPPAGRRVFWPLNQQDEQ